MKALRFSRKEGRYAAAMAASRLRPGSGAAVGPLSLIDDDAPELPTPDWVRVYPRLAGICGSDLSTVDGHAGPRMLPLGRRSASPNAAASPKQQCPSFSTQTS